MKAREKDLVGHFLIFSGFAGVWLLPMLLGLIFFYHSHFPTDAISLVFFCAKVFFMLVSTCVGLYAMHEGLTLLHEYEEEKKNKKP